MRRGVCIFLLVLWLGTLPWAGVAAEAPKAAAPAKAAPPAKAVEPPKTAEPAKTPEPAKKSAPQEEDVYELQRLLVDTLDQVQRNYVREVSRRKLVEAAIKGILSELDPYSNYIGPEEIDQFRTVVESEFGGIGIQITVEDGQLRVLSPLVGTPAYRAGLMAGDRILEIDGKSTENLRIDEAVRRLKGKEGTQVRLTVLHPGKRAPDTLTVTRESIHVDTVLGDHRKADDRWDFLLDPPRRIAYVRVTAFSRDTASELRKVLTELKKEKIRGLILDLRFNPGGLLNSAIDVADLFVSQGRIVSVAGRNSPERAWEAHKKGTFEGFPMAVLVNRYSASASEIVAACLQDHRRAVVVGERTWGKGSVQNVIPLEDGAGSESPRPDVRSALKLTTAGYHRPSGKNIDRPPKAKETDEWGVTPDKGLDLRLDGQEMQALSDDWHQRDILLPKKPDAGAKPDAAAKPATGKPASPAPETPAAAKPPQFADRQLRMALDYLTAELARADGPGGPKPPSAPGR